MSSSLLRVGCVAVCARVCVRAHVSVRVSVSVKKTDDHIAMSVDKRIEVQRHADVANLPPVLRPLPRACRERRKEI